MKFLQKPALNAGTTDKVPRMKLREKNEEAAILSPDNGRYKKSQRQEGIALGEEVVDRLGEDGEHALVGFE